MNNHNSSKAKRCWRSSMKWNRCWRMRNKWDNFSSWKMKKWTKNWGRLVRIMMRCWGLNSRKCRFRSDKPILKAIRWGSCRMSCSRRHRWYSRFNWGYRNCRRIMMSCRIIMRFRWEKMNLWRFRLRKIVQNNNKTNNKTTLNKTKSKKPWTNYIPNWKTPLTKYSI